MSEISVVNGEIAISERAMAELKKLQEFQVTIQEMKQTESELKEMLLEAMEQNGIKSFKNDFVEITYMAPSVRTTVDTAALKAQDLYDMFSKSTPVGAQVRIKYK